MTQDIRKHLDFTLKLCYEGEIFIHDNDDEELDRNLKEVMDNVITALLFQFHEDGLMPTVSSAFTTAIEVTGYGFAQVASTMER
jgi:hypothetical protein